MPMRLRGEWQMTWQMLVAFGVPAAVLAIIYVAKTRADQARH
jgi:hypothetical protein